MTKAMFVIATALALATSPAWADDESSEKASDDTVTKSENKAKLVSARATPKAAEARRDSATMDATNEVPSQAGTSDAERWLREREGYRDGGY